MARSRVDHPSRLPHQISVNGIGCTLDLQALGFRARRRINHESARLWRRYRAAGVPALGTFTDRSATVTSRFFSEPFPMIVFNTAQVDHSGRVLDSGAKQRDTVGGDDVETLLRHEWGHHLDYRLMQVKGAQEDLNEHISELLGSSNGPFPDVDSTVAEVVAVQISRYASLRRPELIAEAIAQYESSHRPSPIAATIGGFLLSRLGRHPAREMSAEAVRPTFGLLPNGDTVYGYSEVSHGVPRAGSRDDNLSLYVRTAEGRLYRASEGRITDIVASEELGELGGWDAPDGVRVDIGSPLVFVSPSGMKRVGVAYEAAVVRHDETDSPGTVTFEGESTPARLVREAERRIYSIPAAGWDVVPVGDNMVGFAGNKTGQGINVLGALQRRNALVAYVTAGGKIAEIAADGSVHFPSEDGPAVVAKIDPAPTNGRLDAYVGAPLTIPVEDGSIELGPVDKFVVAHRAPLARADIQRITIDNLRRQRTSPAASLSGPPLSSGLGGVA